MSLSPEITYEYYFRNASIYYCKEHNDGSDIYIPCDVLQYPEAFEKLCRRYS